MAALKQAPPEEVTIRLEASAVSDADLIGKPHGVHFLRSDGTWAWGTIQDWADAPHDADATDVDKKYVRIAFVDPVVNKMKNKEMVWKDADTVFLERVPSEDWHPPTDKKTALCWGKWQTRLAADETV